MRGLALQDLSKLKAGQLALVAQLCGINKSGSKPIVAERIVNSVQTAQPLTPECRVLSIDLGLRNLAYSLVELRWPKGKSPIAKEDKRSTLLVLDWQRLSLLPAQGLKANQVDDDAGLSEPEAQKSVSSSRLSRIAVDLVRERLLPLKPTHVLIEQQRARSGGGANVFEWTLRVNALEAMLHAIFSYLQASGQWKGTLSAVDPGRVSRYLLGFEGLSPPLKSGTSEMKKRRISSPIPTAEHSPEPQMEVAQNTVRSPGVKKASEVKKEKMTILAGLLENDGMISFESEAASDMAEAFRGSRKTAVARKKTAGLHKMDDVTDCLLQALVWTEWQSNKKTLLEGGLDSLLGVAQETSALRASLTQESPTASAEKVTNRKRANRNRTKTATKNKQPTD